MKFTETEIAGVFLVDLEPRTDDRGFFARAFCMDEFRDHGLEPEVVQANLIYSAKTGTTRGLHYQTALAPEAKFFRCIQGETFNVAVDLREDSPTFRSWVGASLSAANRRGLYIPPVCAAGFQTLTSDAEILYTVSGYYTPEAERGVRFDDPMLGVEFPLEPTVVSDRDRSWPLLA